MILQIRQSLRFERTFVALERSRQQSLVVILAVDRLLILRLQALDHLLASHEKISSEAVPVFLDFQARRDKIIANDVHVQPRQAGDGMVAEMKFDAFVALGHLATYLVHVLHQLNIILRQFLEHRDILLRTHQIMVLRLRVLVLDHNYPIVFLDFEIRVLQ